MRDTCHVWFLCAVATQGSVASYKCANVGGHASQRDNCHVCLLCAVAGGNAVPPLRSEPLEAPPLRGGWEGSSKNGEMLGEMSGEVFR